MVKNAPLASILSDIADAAPRLRATGVTRVRIGTISVNLSPSVAAVRDPKPSREPTIGDLDDFMGETRLREREDVS